MSDFVGVPFLGGPIKRKKREASIEATCVKFMVIRGWMHKKVGTNGWPDHMFLRNGRIVFVEFKRPKKDGGRASAQQGLRAKELRANGFTVFFIDSAEAMDRVFG